MKKLESSFANMVIVLTVITVIAAACLGAMNNATAEPIAASKKAKQEAAIKAVLPEFASVDTAVIVNEQKIFRAYDAENNLVGIAIETAELGLVATSPLWLVLMQMALLSITHSSNMPKLQVLALNWSIGS